MVVITLSSLFDLSGIDTGGVSVPYADKGVHFVFYFFAVVLGVLCLEERKQNNGGTKKILVVVLLGSIAYGVLIEGLQWLMPFGREADIWDIVANSLGAITGGLLIQMYGSLIRRRN